MYDDANRLIDVNGVTYTWDNNGNLLNDGVNTYSYDAANRLTALSGQQLAVSYSYRCNGESIGQVGCENDRVSQTVNGVTTNYVLDSASALTQVLQDGTNSYIYGVDRIAQMNGTIPEYFLTDGLGSVRQLVDSNGAVLLAKNYDPYGTETGFIGSGLSSYGFTGEMTDPTGLIYLRARYLAPTDGRFLTKDTWRGNHNKPLSLNRWAYVEGNPINYTDPTGHIGGSNGCGALGYASPYFAARNYVDKGVTLPKSDWLNTYAAAGIAVQCWAGTIQDFVVRDPDYSGLGPGQIANIWASTPYGEWIEDPAYQGETTHNRGYGLRCYLPVAYLRLPKDVQLEIAKSCVYCFQKDQIAGIANFEQQFALEPIYNQKYIDGATVYMKRMIQLIVNACKARGCGDTDIYIAASLAQSGPLFTIYNLTEKELQELPVPRQNEHVKMNWVRWFQDGGNRTSKELWRFNEAIKGLSSRNWAVPYIDTNTVDELINRSWPQ